jgi:hypothetical protein
MPIWAVLVLLIVCSVASWFTGAMMIGTHIVAKVSRRAGKRQAEWLLRPNEEE